MEISKAGNKPVSAKNISENNKLPTMYMERICNWLRSANIIESKRGMGGGYRLLYTIEQLTVLDIIDAVGERFKLTDCSGCERHGRKFDQAFCLIHGFLHFTESKIIEFFANTTVKDLYLYNSNFDKGIGSKGKAKGMAILQNYKRETEKSDESDSAV